MIKLFVVLALIGVVVYVIAFGAQQVIVQAIEQRGFSDSSSERSTLLEMSDPARAAVEVYYNQFK